MNIGELKQLQSLPLQAKINKTIRVVRSFTDQYDAYVSIGGNDSYTLNHILESHNIHLPKASIASCEPYGNNVINSKLDDIHFLRPNITKKELIRKRGYPVISKNLSMAVDRFHAGEEEQKHRRLWGYQGEKKVVKDGTIPIKYHNLIYAPFELTEKCCPRTKEDPLNRWAKKNNLYPITGEIAEESNNRLREYLAHGCIMNDKKGIKCTPLGFWTQQDILKYNIENKMVLSTEYKSIIKVDEQQSIFEDVTYKFEGEQRTGCDICTFGIMYDKDRFKRMHDNKPLKWSGMMNGGECIECEPRLMILKPNTLPVMHNKKWVPSKQGYGYRFVIEWLNGMFNANILIGDEKRG